MIQSWASDAALKQPTSSVGAFGQLASAHHVPSSRRLGCNVGPGGEYSTTHTPFAGTAFVTLMVHCNIFVAFKNSHRVRKRRRPRPTRRRHGPCEAWREEPAETRIIRLKTLRVATRKARQSHFVLESPPKMSDVTASMKSLAALGLEILVTEFDVQVPLTATVEKLQHQAQIYRSYQALVFSLQIARRF
jgi:hypothetical protein